MSANEPVHFAGLPNWVKITVVFAALLLGGLSIGLAWKDASDANKNLAFGQKDVEVVNMVTRLGQTGMDNDQALVVHTLNSIIHLKGITNHQSLAGLAIGAGSAFLAIGFALFLLGADGAFRIQFSGKGDSKLAFYATAPGLLCFVLGAILIVTGTTRKHEIFLGDFDLIGDKPISQKETIRDSGRSVTSQGESKAPSQLKPDRIGKSSLPSRTIAADSERETLLTAHICIDRLLRSDIARAGVSFRVRGGSSRAIAPIGKTWMNGSTLRVTFLDGDPTLQAKVKKYAEEWMQHANIRFEFESYPNAEIRISFKALGLWSYIGTDGRQVAQDEPTMNLGGISTETEDINIRSVVLHEFGHALGLEHEFAPPTSEVQWNRPFVYQFFAQSSNQWSPEQADSAFIQKYSIARINGTDFDPKSIMIMAVPKEFTLNGFQIPWNRQLSDGDKKLIASPRFYPRTSK